METTIEEKHARATFEARKSHVGLTRISLSNRMPLLTRLLAREPNIFDCFLQCFEQMRSLPGVPLEMGLDSHPYFARKSTRHTREKLLTNLRDVLYHNDYGAETRSLKKEMKTQNKMKAKLVRAEAQVMSGGPGPKTPPGLPGIKKVALNEHFMQNCEVERFYSLPALAETSLIRLSLETIRASR